MTDIATFESDVDSWIDSACEKGIRIFGDLVGALPGVDPVFLHARIAVRGLLETGVVQLRSEVARTPISDVETGLPIPHPLDFDWRFDQQSVKELCREIAREKGPTVLLGTPSLALGMAPSQSRSDTLLVDRNPTISAALSSANVRCTVATEDMFTWAPSNCGAALVVADPPWYPNAMEAFVWCAASVARPGARILLSAPQVGTRPGIHAERMSFVEYAQQCGLLLHGIRTGAVRYTTPPFERNALSAAGLSDSVPSDWRRGDLFVLERRADSSMPVRPLPSPNDVGWVEHATGGVRIRIQVGRGDGDSRDPRLVSIVGGDILPTVSRRDARRAGARVWTSGNRVFGCKAPALLAQILAAGEGQLTPWAMEAREGVERVVQLERTEYIMQHSHDRTFLGAAPDSKGK